MTEYIEKEIAIKSGVGALRGVSHVVAVDVAQAIEDLPAANVVPKSEVERLSKELDNLAREIFEEIDVLVDDRKHSRIQSIQFIAELAELKKKYIGGGC